jgi:hypothetical protein
VLRRVVSYKFGVVSLVVNKWALIAMMIVGTRRFDDGSNKHL